MKCPYDNKGCDGVDTSGMTKIDCKNCYRYNNGVRATGATPVLEWILRKFGYRPKEIKGCPYKLDFGCTKEKECKNCEVKKQSFIDEWNNFMKGL